MRLRTVLSIAVFVALAACDAGGPPKSGARQPAPPPGSVTMPVTPAVAPPTACPDPAQIIAAALGARVYANPVREIGWWPLQLLPAAADSPLFRGFPAQVEVFHWHGDTFDLPPGVAHIARSAAFLSGARR